MEFSTSNARLIYSYPKFKAKSPSVPTSKDVPQVPLVLVLALTAAAIAEPLGDHVLGQLCAGASAWITPADLMRLLDPRSVDDWLTVRPLLVPSGKLRQERIVKVRPTGGDRGACSDLDGTAFLSRDAFKIVVGQPCEGSEQP